MTTDELNTIKRDMRRMMQDTGDAISSVFDQMLKGNWRDDHDHDVTMNNAMVGLKAILAAMVEYRNNNPWTLECEDDNR